MAKPTPQPKPATKHPMELMVIGYDFNGNPFIMHCQGPNIEGIVIEGGTALSSYVTCEQDIEMAGQVRIYEVSPVEDDEGISFDGGSWREAKGMEWAAITTGAYLATWKHVGEGARYRETILRKTKKLDAPKEEPEE